MRECLTQKNSQVNHSDMENISFIYFSKTFRENPSLYFCSFKAKTKTSGNICRQVLHLPVRKLTNTSVYFARCGNDDFRRNSQRTKLDDCLRQELTGGINIRCCNFQRLYFSNKSIVKTNAFFCLGYKNGKKNVFKCSTK